MSPLPDFGVSFPDFRNSGFGNPETLGQSCPDAFGDYFHCVETDAPGEAGPLHSFDQVIADARYREAVRRTAKAGSARIGVSEMLWKPGRVQNLGTEYAVLVLYNTAAPIRHIIGGETRPTRKFISGDLVLRPPNLEYATEYDDAVDITVFALDPRLIQSMTSDFNANVEEVVGRLEARPFRAPLIEGLARQLADATREGGERLYADALTQALVHEVWRTADGRPRLNTRVPGKLCPRALRRVDEAIADAPASQIALEALAELAGMPMPAFSREMKATTGQTPYQYVLSRRLTMAKDLIEGSALTLAEIAFRCGFSSQSHMTDVFRTKLGVSPGKLRSG